MSYFLSFSKKPPVGLSDYIKQAPPSIREALELVASHPFGRSIIESSGEHEKGLPALGTKKVRRLSDRITLASYSPLSHGIIVNTFDLNNRSKSIMEDLILDHLASKNHLASSLIHEFRHASQFSHWNSKKHEQSSPFNNFFFNQIIEADAAAIESILNGIFNNGDFNRYSNPNKYEYIERYKEHFCSFLFEENAYKYPHLKKAEPYKPKQHFFTHVALPLLQVPSLIANFSKGDWVGVGVTSLIMAIPFALDKIFEQMDNRNYQSPWANEKLMKELIRGITIQGLQTKDIKVFSEDEIDTIVSKFFDQYSAYESHLGDSLNNVSDKVAKKLGVKISVTHQAAPQ